MPADKVLNFSVAKARRELGATNPHDTAKCIRAVNKLIAAMKVAGRGHLQQWKRSRAKS